MSRKLISLITTFAMIMTMFASAIPANAESTPRYATSGTLTHSVNYDCVYFGSYPQTEIVSNKNQCGTTGRQWAADTDYILDATLYSQLASATGWNDNNDITIGNAKYHRMKKADAVAKGTGNYYYNWANDTDYHYFKYEPIKWRILEKDGNDIYVVSDVGLDNRVFYRSETEVSWETSDLRTWLNGYFLSTAFSSSEQASITSTGDKVSVMSLADATNFLYGFSDIIRDEDTARALYSSTYAKAMGIYTDLGKKTCYYWLQDKVSGLAKIYAPDQEGYIKERRINLDKTAVRPALHLDMTSQYVKDAGNTGKVSEQTFTEIPLNDEYKLYTYIVEPAINIPGLVKDVDYNVTYSNNRKVGKATVTVTGIGDCSGTLTRDFDIVKGGSGMLIPISTKTASLSSDSFVYDGSAKTPSVNIEGLTLDNDFTVAYENNINVTTDTSKAKVTITGINDYSGTIEKYFAITPASISNCTASLVSDSVSYTGSALTPKVTVKNSKGTELVKDTDYTVAYSNNKEVGTATITITGKGNYTGTLAKNFTISKNSISGKTATLGYTSVGYDGTAKTPSVTISGLTKDTDYKVTYSNNTNASTDTNKAKVTIEGIGTYEGTIEKYFVITPASISNKTAELSKTSYVYNGEERKPTVTISGLKSGTDFDVAYSNNINAGDTENTASVVITGKGNYTGTKALKFTITKADLSVMNATLSPSAFDYDGSAKRPAVSITGLTLDTDYKVTYSNNVNATTETSKASVLIEGKGNYTGSKTIYYTILAKSISTMSATLSQTSYVYDGTAKTPDVTVVEESNTGDDVILEKGTDYSVTYSNNIATGNASVKIEGINNYKGTITKTFTISKGTIEGATVNSETGPFVYTGSAIEPEVTSVVLGGKTLTKDDYTVSYVNNVNASKDDSKAVIKIEGKGDYSGTITKEFVISKASMSSNTVSLKDETFEYDGNAKTTEVTVTTKSETKLTEDTDYEVTYSDNINAGTATVTVTGKNNWTGTKTATFEITPVSITGKTVDIDVDEPGILYTGEALTPSFSVDGLGEGDYSAKYSNNVNAGEATITVKGEGNYTGTISGTFNIIAADIRVNVATLPENAEYVYDGTAKEPEVTVTKASGKTLVEDTDYSVAYSDNVNKGEATVTISGINNYCETITLHFEILAADISNMTASFENTPSYIYSGSAKTPAVTVEGLSATDYDVDYGDNVSAGTVNVTITGKGNYTGTIDTLSFEIAQKAITIDDFALEEDEYTFDGSAKTPAVVSDLVLDQDYEVVYPSDKVNAEEGKVVTIKGIGNYRGEIEKTYDINTVDISGYTVALQDENQEYDGTEKTPAIDFYDGEKKVSLTEDTDYTIAYSNNVNAGDAVINIEGIGNYSGSIVSGFTISPIDISGNMTISTPFEYTGQSIEFTDESLSELGLKLSDCDIQYDDNNIDIGTKEAVITAKSANWTGSITVAYEIVAADIANMTASFVVTPEFTYDGTAKTPEVQVEGLTADDYNVSYGEDNINAGTVTVTITGKGNYTGTNSDLSFEIAKKAITADDFSLKTVSYKYDGKAKKPEVASELSTADYTVTYEKDTVSAGKKTVTIEGKGNYTGKVTKSYTVKQASLSGKTAKLSYATAVYSGKTMKPTVTISGLKNGTDYTVAYSNNKYCGKATVKITGKGNYTGSIAAYFNITPAKAALSKVTAGSKKITVAIKSQKTSKVSGYQIYYKKSGSAAKTVNTTSTSKTLSSLTKGKKYTVKVRAYTIIDKKIVYGAYSTAKTVTVK